MLMGWQMAASDSGLDSIRVFDKNDHKRNALLMTPDSRTFNNSTIPKAILAYLLFRPLIACGVAGYFYFSHKSSICPQI